MSTQANKNTFNPTNVSKGLIGDSVGSGRPPKLKTAKFYERQIAKREAILKTAQDLVVKREAEVAQHIDAATSRAVAFVQEARNLVITVEDSIARMKAQYREHLEAEKRKIEVALAAD